MEIRPTIIIITMSCNETHSSSHIFVMIPQTLGYYPLNTQSPPPSPPPTLDNTLTQGLWQPDHPIQVPPH